MALGRRNSRDAVDQHAAGCMESFQHGDVVTHLHQVRSAGQAGRAGAQHCHFMAVGRHFLGLFGAVLHVVVGAEALQAANGHALALDAPHAFALALVFLGADTAADGGQCGSLRDLLVPFFKLALSHQGDELGDLYRSPGSR